MILGIGKPPEPNPIDTVAVPGTVGCMGLVGCPGTRIEQYPTASKRQFQSDIDAISEWGANGVLCLVEPHELKILKVEHLPKAVQDAGMWWLQLPIMDMEIPTQEFEDQWAVEGERIRPRRQPSAHPDQRAGSVCAPLPIASLTFLYLL